MIKLAFWFSIILLIYTHTCYYSILSVTSSFIRGKSKSGPLKKHYPYVTVLVAAFNEEKPIGERIRNLLELDYPKEKLEIIIASDGSTDGTVNAARQYEKYGVKVFDFKQNRGKAAVHNDCIKKASGETVLFTDAETIFDNNFLKEVVKYFLDDRIGCVVGNLVYRTKETSVSESEGLYWKFERRLRELESDRGILATATGACMAIRKGLWRELTPTDDSDFTTPLDVILQGYRVVCAPGAIAYDVPSSSIKSELRARIRQTSKNLMGTLKRWGWRGWTRHPFVSWGLLSHKILRWFTPFFMIGAFLNNLFLLNEGLFYQLTFTTQAAFYLLAIAGLIGELLKKKIPIVSTIFSFCLANTGMGIGVIKGLIGKAPAAYKTEG